nr:DUF3782 domain-containing protein [Candidatus Sigynarchaeota archaeon]
MPIDIAELLEILPRLVRENDTVKGAIITALSGVVATREDIKELIREMDKRFEQVDNRFGQVDNRFEQVDKRFEQVDKRFDSLETTVQDGLKHVHAAISNIGDRSGKGLERTVLELMRHQLLEEKEFDYTRIDRETLEDKEGLFFTQGFSTDVDVVAKDGMLHLFEIKYKADQRDVQHFLKVAKLYEHVHGKQPDRLYIVSLEITKKTLDAIRSLPVRIIAGTIVE